MPMDDGLVSEPPWWLVVAEQVCLDNFVFSKCNCQNADGSVTQLDDCPRLQKCDKCCQGRVGENLLGVMTL